MTATTTSLSETTLSYSNTISSCSSSTNQTDETFPYFICMPNAVLDHSYQVATNAFYLFAGLFIGNSYGLSFENDTTQDEYSLSYIHKRVGNQLCISSLFELRKYLVQTNIIVELAKKGRKGTKKYIVQRNSKNWIFSEKKLEIVKEENITSKPKENFTRIPLSFFLNMHLITPTEWKTLFFIMRRNYGMKFPNHRRKNEFSSRFLQEHLGMGYGTVQKALDGLLKKNMLIQMTELGNEGTFKFEVQWNSDAWILPEEQKKAVVPMHQTNATSVLHLKSQNKTNIKSKQEEKRDCEDLALHSNKRSKMDYPKSRDTTIPNLETPLSQI